MNFKALRENKLKISKEQLASMLGVSITEINQWEENNNPPVEIIGKIASNTNLDFNTILNYEKPTLHAFVLENKWEKVNSAKSSIIDYIQTTLGEIEVSNEFKEKYISDLQIGLEKSLSKPIISIVGRSDTGKSTLINALLGMHKMPTNWTPTTSIAVYIKHINDRPQFISDDAWIFTDTVDGEELWDVKKLYDQAYCEKWKIAQGSVDILHDFGTRQGDMYQQNAGSAVIFLDAPILLDCDIVDLPGYGTETETDDTITFHAAQKTDILIYLSQANGFMRIEDINYLKENIRNLPVWEKNGENDLKPLSNLFIVASQSHTIGNGNPIELSKILQKGYENFSKTLAPQYWTERENISGYNNFQKSILANRFFTYTTDIPSLCTRFNNELKSVLELLPEVIEKKAALFIQEYIKTQRRNLEAEIKKNRNLLDQRNDYAILLSKIESNELSRAQNNDLNRQSILDLINTLSINSVNEFTNYCSETINTDSIIEKIKKQKITNKKEDIDCFVSQLQDELQNKVISILEENSKTLSPKIKQYVTKFEYPIKKSFEESSIAVDFNAEYTFSSSLAKVAGLGGLSAYLAGSTALMLGSVPFSLGIGGTIATIATALGPVGMVAGITLAAGMFLKSVFGERWENKTAKNIVKAYEDKHVVDMYRSSINAYWHDTENAFQKAAQNLEDEWNKYVNTLRKTIHKYDVEEIKSNIVKLQNIGEFFDHIEYSLIVTASANYGIK